MANAHKQEPRQPPVTFTCENCGQKFARKMWLVRQQQKAGSPIRFCNKSCMGKAKNLGPEHRAEVHRKAQKKYRESHKEQDYQKNLKWNQANPEKVRGYAKASYRKNIDAYAARAFKRRLAQITNIELPEAFIEAKVMQLKLTRLLKGTA